MKSTALAFNNLHCESKILKILKSKLSDHNSQEIMESAWLSLILSDEDRYVSKLRKFIKSHRLKSDNASILEEIQHKSSLMVGGYFRKNTSSLTRPYPMELMHITVQYFMVESIDQLQPTPLLTAIEFGYLSPIVVLFVKQMQWRYNRESSWIDDRTEEGWGPFKLAWKRGHHLTVAFMVKMLRHFEVDLPKDFPNWFGEAARFELYKNGDYKSISAFLSNITGWIVMDFFNWACTCSEDKVDLVRRLMDDKVVDVHETTSEVVLWFAFEARHYEMMEMLLTEKWIDINASMNPDGHTMLNMALKDNDIDMMQFLLKHNANVHQKDDKGRTPLFVAAQYNRIDFIQFLLKQNAAVSVTDESGSTAFHVAANAGHIGALKMIYEHIITICNGEKQKINEFVNATDLNGLTPLYRACSSKQLEVFQYLMNTVKVCTQFPRKFDEHSWVRLYEDGDYKLISIFLSNSTGRIISLFLEWACKRNQVDLVRRLMNDKIVNVDETMPETPLWIAFEARHYQMLEMLITEGSADVNAQRHSDQFTMLNVAVRDNLVGMFQFLLKHGANVHEKDGKGRTPLFIAAQFNRIGVIQFLLKNNEFNGRAPLRIVTPNNLIRFVWLPIEHKVDAAAITESGRNVFHAAANQGHINVLRMIYEHITTVWNGEEQKISEFVNLGDSKGFTPLYSACCGYHVDAVNYLVNTVKVDVQKAAPLFTAAKRLYDKKRFDVIRLLLGLKVGVTPLVIARTKDEIQIVQLMLQHNPDVNVQSNFRETSIIVVPKERYIEIVIATHKEYIRHRADLNAVDEKGRTALHLATISRNSNFVEVLLNEASLDLINRRDHRTGSTALMEAVKNRHKQILQLLLNHQADPTLADNNGETPMIVAIKQFDWSTDIIQLLLKHKGGINIADMTGRTPLRIAMSRCTRSAISKHWGDPRWGGYRNEDYMRVMRVLLNDPSLDTDSWNKDGRTPLCAAVEMKKTSIIKLLLEYKVNVDAPNRSGQTPLIIATTKDHIGGIKLLLEHKADIEKRDRKGRTPLIIAVQNNRIKIVRLLLEHNADLTATDCKGRTAMMIAKTKGHQEIIQLLTDSVMAIEPNSNDNAKDEDDS